MQMKKNLQDSIRLYKFQKQKSKSKPKQAKFRGKIEKTNLKSRQSKETIEIFKFSFEKKQNQ